MTNFIRFTARASPTGFPRTAGGYTVHVIRRETSILNLLRSYLWLHLRWLQEQGYSRNFGACKLTQQRSLVTPRQEVPSHIRSGSGSGPASLVASEARIR